MTQTAKEDYLIVRVSAEEKSKYKKLATETYGFPNTGEFLRYALAYIEAKQPILGKSFAPGNAIT